jgi:hypothetical protein
LELTQPELIPAVAVAAEMVDDLGGSEDAALAAQATVRLNAQLVPSALLPACEPVPVPPRDIRVRGTAAGHGLHTQPFPPEDRRGEHEGAADELRDVDPFELERDFAARVAAGAHIRNDVGATAHILVTGDDHEIALQWQRTEVDFENVELRVRFGEARAVERLKVEPLGVKNSAPFERWLARLADDGMKDDRLARCGAIISMPSRRNSSSRASLS